MTTEVPRRETVTWPNSFLCKYRIDFEWLGEDQVDSCQRSALSKIYPSLSGTPFQGSSVGGIETASKYLLREGSYASPVLSQSASTSIPMACIPGRFCVGHRPSLDFNLSWLRAVLLRSNCIHYTVPLKSRLPVTRVNPCHVCSQIGRTRLQAPHSVLGGMAS